MAEMARTQAIHRKDYRPPSHLIDKVDLTFKLSPSATEVTSVLRMRTNPDGAGLAGELRLDGEDLSLLALACNGTRLDDDSYRRDDTGLTLRGLPETFELTVVTRIDPQANTALEGLYLSNGKFCTQCEAEGFRKITYFLDRPDVMTRFTTRIEADQAAYPVLLSNGNPIEAGSLGEGRHFAVWDDPHPKPSYLFALVAGDLGVVSDHFTTRSGRKVELRIYTEHDKLDAVDHAMASLKKSMRWDEDVYGLEYDLDIFMIVAVSDFNMGAMENKGLNIFNTKYVLAKPDSATDMDFLGVEGIIAHEYFHNWTGNRVTCRDWFQLTLKEGLTVFRDQEFSSDVNSRPVKRIQDVRRLRASQFPEDSGPLAHPIRPDSYVEVNNFYTATVYEKGAEVIRMIHTLIGAQAFRKGMDLYIERHDNHAVTCEDFVRAMEDASGRDLGQFRRWYEQAGTPKLSIKGAYEADHARFTLNVRQSTPPTPGQPDKRPLHIPLAVGLIGKTSGSALPLQLEGENAPRGDSRVLEITEAEQRFVFTGVAEAPVPSLLRGFSAPVTLDADTSLDDLAYLAAKDSDPFARWEAGQSLALALMLELIGHQKSGRRLTLDDRLVAVFADTMADASLDPAFKALALTLPSESYIGQQMEVIDPDAIHAVRYFVVGALADALRAEWHALFDSFRARGETVAVDGESIGRRALANSALVYMAAGSEPALDVVVARADGARSMTDRMAALGHLCESDAPERSDVLGRFYSAWQGDDLVIDKWFSVQAMAQRRDAVEQARALTGHEAFRLSNPNRVRALIGAFAMANPTGFHRADGAGYAFLTEHIEALDARNPQLAARLAGAFGRWRRYDPSRQQLMKAQLEQVRDRRGLSKDVFEIVTKSLA